MRKLLLVALNMAAQHIRIVSLMLENKERMMLVVVGALLGKDESESIS